MALIVQTCGVVGTLIAATIGVRSYVNSNKRAEESRAREMETRQAQLFASLFQVMSSKEFMTDLEEMVHVWSWTSYDDYMKKYGPLNLEGNGKLTTTITTISGMAVLVRRKLIDVNLADELLGMSTIEVWEKFSPIFHEWIKRFNAPGGPLGEFEYIYNEFSRIREAKGLGKTRLIELR